MSSDFFLLEQKADLPLALEFADRGFAVVPLTPSAQQALAERATSASAFADTAVQLAVIPSQEDAERMADEMMEAIAKSAPDILRYRELDLAPALLHGVYHYLALGVAFARRIATLVREQAGRNEARVVLVEERALSGPIRPMMEELGIDVLPMKAGDKLGKTPLGSLKAGTLRTLGRDLPLMAKRSPQLVSSRRPRIVLLASARTHPSLCADVLRLLQDEFSIEIYGKDFAPEVPEGVTVLAARRFNEYSFRTASAIGARWRHYRAGLRSIAPVTRALQEPHWQGTASLIGKTLPVIIDRATYFAEQSLNFAKSGPDLVIMMDERSLVSRLVSAACAVHSVPTLDIQHGMFLADPGLRNISYDKFAVFGEATKRLLMDWGVKESSIEITGCPRFDAYRSKPAASRDQILSPLGLDPNRPVVLGATQPIRNTMTMGAKREFIAGLLDGVRDGRYQLLLKKHPYETDTLAEQLSAGMSNVGLTNARNLADFISASDAVATISSTAGFEALVLGRPLVVFRPDWMTVPFPFGFDGGADPTDRDGLGPALERALEMDREAAKTKADTFLAGYIRFDGSSAQRIADLVRRMMRERVPE